MKIHARIIEADATLETYRRKTRDVSFQPNPIRGPIYYSQVSIRGGGAVKIDHESLIGAAKKTRELGGGWESKLVTIMAEICRLVRRSKEEGQFVRAIEVAGA